MKRFSTYIIKIPVANLPSDIKEGSTTITMFEEYKTTLSSRDSIKVTKEATIDGDYLCATFEPADTKRFVEGAAKYQARGLTNKDEAWFSDEYSETVEDVLDQTVLSVGE